jgi:hypothetical protein
VLQIVRLDPVEISVGVPETYRKLDTTRTVRDVAAEAFLLVEDRAAARSIGRRRG